MAQCERDYIEPGIELKTWTGDRQAYIQCTITNQDDQVYHYVEVVNKRGKNYNVDVTGFTQSTPHILEFKHLANLTIGRKWQMRQILVHARTKRFGKYSREQATVFSIAAGHGDESVYTEFIYTPQGENAYPAIILFFDVHY